MEAAPNPALLPNALEPGNASTTQTSSSGELLPEKQPKVHPILPFPREVIWIVYEHLGPPPKNAVYELEDIKDVHPCYAICSLSKGIRDQYIFMMGQPSVNIDLTIHPTDYLIVNEDPIKILKERFDLMGYYGRNRVTSCHIMGAMIETQIGNLSINRWLSPITATRRLEPEHKVLIKQHVEQDIKKKTLDIENLFESLAPSFRRIHLLEISPAELPANVWEGPLKKYVLKRQRWLTDFSFLDPTQAARSGGYGYYQILYKLSYFATRKEQPSNYPGTSHITQNELDRLQDAITGYLEATKKLKDFVAKV